MNKIDEYYAMNFNALFSFIEPIINQTNIIC